MGGWDGSEEKPTSWLLQQYGPTRKEQGKEKTSGGYLFDNG